MADWATDWAREWANAWTRPRRLLLRYRRALAATLGGLAVLLGLSALSPSHRVSANVVVTARALPAGAVIGVSDLATAEFGGAAPHSAYRSVAAVVGRTLAGPMSAGEPVTPERLIGSSLLAGQPAGTVAAVVRVHDAAETQFIRPGDRVDVYAAVADDKQALLLIAAARVLAVPPAPSSGLDSSGLDSSGLDSSGLGSGEGGSGVLLVAATRQQASRLAQASAADPLYLTLDM